ASLALHFDLTVPFARYVAQHFNELHFPFKRYQLQKVWRGERPQKGRFREFYQFDIDTIARDELPLTCDAEVISVLEEVFRRIGIGTHILRLNDRRLLHGMYQALGVPQEKCPSVVVVVDKIAKIGPQAVLQELRSNLSLDLSIAEKIVEFSKLSIPSVDAAKALPSLGIKNDQFDAAVKDLLHLIELLPAESAPHVVIDLSLARGLDYYTGVIVEVSIKEYPEFGTVASGGRYDDLASRFINKRLPGVGVSFGLSRFMDLIFANNILPQFGNPALSCLVAVYSEEQRSACLSLARDIRQGGMTAEVFYKSPKIGKQIDFAAAKGIRYVFFIDPESGQVQVKDLVVKAQESVKDIEQWLAARGSREAN
ncbi:MAG: ATP phosphoribosyltransferase regulatory subunit, partial [Bdellovibrionales bacterium]|nr:ATP phosphoribosyltransferase regulatory subunit [Bdellovibrionales bacterium]